MNPRETADVVELSDEREPAEVHIVVEEQSRRDYVAIPLDEDQSELGEEFKVTTEYVAEVREKTSVYGEIEFQRNFSPDPRMGTNDEY